MENLLEETIKILKDYRKEISDIKWIGNYAYDRIRELLEED